MSTQTCTFQIDPQAFSLFDNNNNNNNFTTHVDANLYTTTSNTDTDHAFGYDYLNFDPNSIDLPFPTLDGLPMSNIEPNLALPPPTIFNGSNTSIYPPTSLSAPQQLYPAKASSANPTPTIGTQDTGVAKKRRTRKKKAPLPPEVKEAKRRIFLERNREAASKCRERSKQKWDRVQNQVVELEVQNMVLKERWAELKGEFELLTKLASEHRSCGILEAHKEETDARIYATGTPSEGREGGMASAEIEAEQNQMDVEGEVDMLSFIADGGDEFPSSSSSNKNFTASADSDFDLNPTPPPKVPSPADSAIDVSAGKGTGFGKQDGMKQEELFPLGGEEDLVPDESLFSLCDFIGQEGKLGEDGSSDLAIGA